MDQIIDRLKSPVMIVQLVTIIGTAVVLLLPDLAPVVKQVVGAVAAVVNIFAGLNNPTDKESF